MANSRGKAEVKTKAMKRRKQNSMNRMLITVMVLIMGVIMSAQMLKLRNKNKEYEGRMQMLQQQLIDEQQVAEQLKQQEEYVNSMQYVEDTAKAKLGMIHSDEIVFKER